MKKMYYLVMLALVSSSLFGASLFEKEVRERLQAAIMEELAPINDRGETQIDVQVNKLKLDATGIRRFEATGHARIYEQDVCAEVSKSIAYSNQHNEEAPELEIKVTIHSDIRGLLGEDFDQMGVQAPDVVAQFLAEAEALSADELGGALSYHAEIIELVFGEDDSLQVLELVQSASLDLALLPDSVDTEGLPVVSESLSLRLTPDSLTFTIKVSFNPNTRYLDPNKEHEFVADGVNKLFQNHSPFRGVFSPNAGKLMSCELKKAKRVARHMQM